MADMAQAPRDFYSIVVAGAMNPALHHPGWYKSQNFIDQQEQDFALTAKPLVVTSQFSNFAAPEFTIVCLPDRWEIQTVKSQAMDRILSVACAVFEALQHTPVGAYGFNFLTNREVGVSKAGQTLAEVLARLPFGFPVTEDAEGEISFITTHEKQKMTVTVSKSILGDNFASIRFNAHHEITATKDTIFDLTPMLRRDFWPDFQKAEAYFHSVASGFRSLKGAHAGRN